MDHSLARVCSIDLQSLYKHLCTHDRPAAKKSTAPDSDPAQGTHRNQNQPSSFASTTQMEVEMDVEMHEPIPLTELSPDLNGIGTATLHSPVLEFSWLLRPSYTSRYDHTITVRFQTAKGVPLDKYSTSGVEVRSDFIERDLP